MSKLVSGDAKITDLDLVWEAAKALGWLVHTSMLGVQVKYFDGNGPICDVVIQPQHEEDARGRDVGSKYTIGFTQDRQTRKVTMYHDNAMNGGAVYSVESGQMDDTTMRVVGKMRQALGEAQITRILHKQRANWRVEQREDGAKVYVVRR